MAVQMCKEKEYNLTDVAVFFGEPDKEVPDPFFNGKGPVRRGCTFCGGCLTGCRFDAKNTLDKNYLYLAQQNGAKILAESKVNDIIPNQSQDGGDGYKILYSQSTSLFKKTKTVTSKGVIFSAGVLGTLPLLHNLKNKSLPNLSNRIGNGIRTNSESLIGVTTFDKQTVFSDGIAIGSILHTDAHSHIEPVRYASGSGFWRLMLAPMASGQNFLSRFFSIIWNFVRHPIKNLRVIFVWDFAKRTQILLFMQTLNSTLKFSLGRLGLKSSMEKGPAPTAFIREAQELAHEFARIVNGKPITLLTESLAGIPTTAHILGGCVMGETKEDGVIDKNNRVFGYKNMYVCDGSMISANPGVNPSLTITALSERAMSKIPAKQENDSYN
jgi:cholesterol oxidase